MIVFPIFLLYSSHSFLLNTGTCHQTIVKYCDIPDTKLNTLMIYKIHDRRTHGLIFETRRKNSFEYYFNFFSDIIKFFNISELDYFP